MVWQFYERQVVTMKKGTLLLASGSVVVVASLVVGVARYLSIPMHEFPELITPGEVFVALWPSIVLLLMGVMLVALGFILPRHAKHIEDIKAHIIAEDLSTMLRSFEDAHEAIRARIDAWERVQWHDETRRREVLSTLGEMCEYVKDLAKMSAWFKSSLDPEVYASALEAIHKIDADKLRALSAFIGYCATVTEYEKREVHFKNACDNALSEVRSALDLYASMRGKLSSFSGSEADRERLIAEIEQISEK
jgi:uncharacterized protein YutE (UPF0331/DUF86 family)